MSANVWIYQVLVCVMVVFVDTGKNCEAWILLDVGFVFKIRKNKQKYRWHEVHF